MSPSQLAELAALLTHHAEEFSADGMLPAATLHRVWKSASAWLTLWRDALPECAAPQHYADLFAMELPLRVWCTAIAGRSRAGTVAQSSGAAIAARLHTDLLATRCVALQELASEIGLSPVEAAQVDRFRRRCERWCDLLIGPLAGRGHVTDFAVNPDRAADFATESTCDPTGSATRPLIDAGLRLTFLPADILRACGCAQPRNRAAAALSMAMLLSFPPGAFDRDGRLRGPGVGRVARLVADSPPPTAAHHNLRRPRPANDVAEPANMLFATLRKRCEDRG